MPKTFILSDGSVNSHGFRVLTDGIALDGFAKNPAMLFNHNFDNIIGKWESVRRNGDQLLADAIFDENDPEAVRLSKKVEQGMLNGVSIGLNVLEVEEGPDGVPLITKSVLKEASLTAIPANSNALRLYDKDGHLMTGDRIAVLLNSHQKPTLPKMKTLQVLAAALKLSVDSNEEQVAAAVQAMVNNNTKLAADLAAEQAKVTELSAKIKAFEGERVKSLVQGAIDAGKIAAAQKEQYEKLAASDFEVTRSILDGIKPHQSLSSQIKSEGQGDQNDPRAKWTIRDWEKKDSKGLLAMKKSEPEKYQKLYDEFYKIA